MRCPRSPARMLSIDTVAVANMTSTCPPSRSVTAGAPHANLQTIIYQFEALAKPDPQNPLGHIRKPTHCR